MRALSDSTPGNSAPIIHDFILFVKLYTALCFLLIVSCIQMAFLPQIKYVNYLRRGLVLVFNCLFLPSIQGMGNTPGQNPCAIGLSLVGLPSVPSPAPVTQHPLQSSVSYTHNLPHELSLAPGGLLCLAPSHRHSQEAEVVHTRPYNSAGALI